MDSDASADQSPFSTLLVGGVAKRWKPLQGNDDLAAIRQRDSERVFRDRYRGRQWFDFNTQNAHARYYILPWRLVE